MIRIIKELSYQFILWTLLTFALISLPGANIMCQDKNHKSEELLSRVIKHYSRYSSIQKKFKYSEVFIDSMKFTGHYLFTFYPSNDKFLILPDSLIDDTFRKVFPNRVKLVKDHLILWNDGTGLKDDITKLLNGKSLIDSFYMKFNPKEVTPENIEKIKYPSMVIDDRKKITYYIISKLDNRLVKVIRTKRYEKIQDLKLKK